MRNFYSVKDRPLNDSDVGVGRVEIGYCTMKKQFGIYAKENKDDKSEKYLSLNNTKCLKGVFAVAILVHHIYQYSLRFLPETPAWGGVLQCLGYLSVGMFFFHTGYGLMLSSKREGYVVAFLKKHVLPLYIFYVVLILAYAIYMNLLGIPIEVMKLVQSFFFGGTIVPLAWYLQATFVLYLSYYAVFRLIDKDTTRVSVMGAALVIYCIICALWGLPTQWYESVFCVLLGMMWAWKKERIDRILKSKLKATIICSTLLFVTLTMLQWKNGMVIAKIFSSIFFAIMVTSLTFSLANTPVINNKVTQLLGKYSLEIYVSQGFFLLMGRHTDIFQNIYVFILTTLIGTMLTAALMKPIYSGVTRGVRKLLKADK